MAGLYNGSDMHAFLANDLDDANFTTCITNKTKVYLAKDIHLHHAQENTITASVFPVLMFQVIVAFFSSQLIYTLLRPLKQPKFVCNILSGIILGRSVLARNKLFRDMIYPEREMIVVNTVSTIGGIFFIFIISVKMDKAMMLRQVKSHWNVGVATFIFPLSISLLLVYLLQDNLPRIRKGNFLFYMTAGLSQTSFPVVADAISELNLLNSELGQLTMSSAILHEIVGWFKMAVAPIIRGGEIKYVLKVELCIWAFIIFSIFILRPGIQRIIRNTPEGKPVNDIYIIAILMGALIMGVIADISGTNYMCGAVMFGLIIPAGPPLGSALAEKSQLMISNFFLPFFYIHLGMLTDIFSITDWKAFASLELIVVATYLGKVAASLLALIWFRTSFRNAIIFSLFLNIKGIVELLTFLRWRARQYLDEQAFTTIVLSHLVVTAIVTPLITKFYKPRARLETMMSIDYVRTLQTTPPDTELRILCCIHCEDNVNSIINLLKASNPSEISPICAYVIHLVELVGRSAPVLVPYNTKKRRKMRNATDRIMSAATRYTKFAGDSITIHPYTMISPYNTMHESICKLVQDKFIPLILLPLNEIQEIEGKKAGLRNFNNNILTYAPCTVGIVIDRGLVYYSNSTNFSYNVAVFFLGGPDDREAMALASRMSSHPGVSITIFRIDMKENLEENEYERKLDGSVINGFKERNISNACVVCRELVANDTMQLMKAVRSIENNYDLVIVGKRQRLSVKLEQELKPWVEYEELGILGDTLASVDFVGGMMSVLVIKCGGRFNGCVRDEGNSLFLPSSNTDRDDKKLGNYEVPRKNSLKVCTQV